MRGGFEAFGMEASIPDRLLSFWSRDDGPSRHYFVIQRSEESPNEVVSRLENIYLELDDQCWGGYGGIERVKLAPNGLTVHLDRHWATEVIGTDTVRIAVAFTDENYRAAVQALRIIMLGYEDRLEITGVFHAGERLGG